MATFAENKVAVAVLISEVEAIQAQADADREVKQVEIDVLASAMMAQEQACGHINWSKVEDKYELRCTSCGKIVTFPDPSVLWPWVSILG